MKKDCEQIGIDKPDGGGATEWESMAEVPFGSELLRSIERVREQAIDMPTAEEGILAPYFKSGVYLFHSSRIEGINSIFSHRPRCRA